MKLNKKYREYSCDRIVRAGCYQCNGFEPMWIKSNAQGVAARHHDATGHDTWVEVALMIFYGEVHPFPANYPGEKER